MSHRKSSMPRIDWTGPVLDCVRVNHAHLVRYLGPPISAEIIPLYRPKILMPSRPSIIIVMSASRPARHIRFLWEDAFMASDLPATTRLVLLVMGTHLNAQGLAFPGTDTLLRKTGLQDRGLRLHLDLAIASGWLERRPSGTGKGAGKDWNKSVFQARVPHALALNAGANYPQALVGPAPNAGANALGPAFKTLGPASDALGPAFDATCCRRTNESSDCLETKPVGQYVEYGFNTKKQQSAVPVDGSAETSNAAEIQERDIDRLENPNGQGNTKGASKDAVELVRALANRMTANPKGKEQP